MNRRGMKYVDSFWNTDLNSSEGFDALRVRMKDGRRLCKDIEEYLRQRAKIEAQYARELQKLAKSNTADFKDEGNLEKAWKELKHQTENMYTAHETAGTNFSKLASEIYSFNDEQRQQTKSVEDKVTKSHNTAKSSLQKCANAHKTYQQKCREWEAARDSLTNAINSVSSITPKEMEKTRNKHNKCKEEMEKADTQYKHSVEDLKTNQDVWEHEHEGGCNILQELDEKRIDHLRDALWKCTNVDSEACVSHDEYAEHVRLSLEKCDIKSETDNFVHSRRTGSTRPASTLYENYFGNQPSTNGKSLSIDRRPAMGTKPRKGVPILPSPTEKSSGFSGFSTYAEIESTEQLTMKAVRVHKSKSKAELSLEVGDIVTCIGHLRDNGMVEVRIEKTGEIGLVPIGSLDEHNNHYEKTCELSG